MTPSASHLRSAALLPGLLIVAACATGSSQAAPGSTDPGPTPAPAVTPPVSDAGGFRLPNDIAWARTSAEYRVIFETTYAEAADAVWAANSWVEGPWGVILDADETVLDNSLYQLERARQGRGYTSESWNAWVRREAATALPGAVDFTRTVKELGGHVAIVTNRDDAVCDATRRNLTAVGIPWDVVLCRQPGISEKETRFESVQEGTTPAGLPPLTVVAWLGDNIGDFPGGSQELRDASTDEILEEFGVRFFVFPNPMYGSWEQR